jgi:hypothetical protein
MNRDVSTDATDPDINRVLAAAAQHSLPVNLLCWGPAVRNAIESRSELRVR